MAAQLRTLLEREGCEEIFQEQVSGSAERAQLAAAIRMLRKGDQLVVTKLDRFARSLEHAIQLERCIAAKGATLVILDPAIDTATPIGRLMFGMLGSVAQFEREIMLDRQRDGIAAAKAAGKYRGRQPTALAKASDVKALNVQGVAKAEMPGAWVSAGPACFVSSGRLRVDGRLLLTGGEPAPEAARVLSLPSIGTRVGLIFFLRAAVPLNFSRVQNLTAARPKGTPSVVTAKQEEN